MSMFNDISCGTKDNEQECLAHARVVFLYARRFGTGQWSFTGPGTPSKRTVHKESGTISRKRCLWNSLRADVRFSMLRLHCPEFNSEAKDGKLSIHFAATQETIEAIFRILLCSVPSRQKFL